MKHHLNMIDIQISNEYVPNSDNIHKNMLPTCGTMPWPYHGNKANRPSNGHLSQAVPVKTQVITSHSCPQGHLPTCFLLSMSRCYLPDDDHKK